MAVPDGWSLLLDDTLGELELGIVLETVGASRALAFGWGGDVQVGTWRRGLLLQAGLIGGENWQSLDAMYVPGRFVTGQVAASYYFPVQGDRIIGVEPIGRLSIADPAGTVDDIGFRVPSVGRCTISSSWGAARTIPWESGG